MDRQQQQANRNRTYVFVCRRSFTTKQGTTISKGQVFQARVSTFHSGATEFFRFTFEDETETTDVACMMAQFHSVDNPKA